MSLTIFYILYSFKLLLLVVIKKSKYKFWKTAIYLSKLDFHQKVLYQRIDSNYFLYRFRIVVFSIYAFCRIFSLAQTNGKNHFILDFRWSRSLFVVRFILLILNYSNFKRNRLQSGFGNYRKSFSEVSDKLITFYNIKSEWASN
jgi:hypothetical protein